MVICDECGGQFRDDTPGLMRFVRGWVKARDGGGGANAVHEMEYLGKLLCPTCWKERQLGGQVSMFGS